MQRVPGTSKGAGRCTLHPVDPAGCWPAMRLCLAIGLTAWMGQTRAAQERQKSGREPRGVGEEVTTTGSRLGTLALELMALSNLSIRLMALAPSGL